MLSEALLKDWLHRDLPTLDKLLIAIASFDKPCSVADLRVRTHAAGLRLPTKMNISAILGRSKGTAIRVPAGWELTGAGRIHLTNLGVSSLSPAAMQVATDIRAHLAKITNESTRLFVEESIKCYEAGLYRSAIVMSWIAAVDVLYRDVAANHLAKFNVEASRVNARWKDAVNEDGLARMGEADFLDRIAAIGIIGKNAKNELVQALNLRNGCGHPNSLKVGPNMVARHIETLLLNVFERFPY
ncbi:hypothetical protein HFN59_21955 [Rhizobium leguminosarum]|uniref:hypothetical protein n=1 Tax=Rhizobium leguminosarum TaxID=384 RepID=UPI001C9688DE|nr:hypothetical protein [Rhizobium leguminosarum]MBY5779739.1 hypothetical protein [Rhizobium leguminosarum]